MHFGSVRNIVETVVDDPDGDGESRITPYHSMFKDKFLQQDILPFGCEVEYLPSNPSYKAEQHSFGPKQRSGIFLGYHLKFGGRWSKDMWIAD